MKQGRIFDIERFSTADGPGIRTVVFFKGCNLNCYWCHNPEGIRMQPELELDETQCIGCGMCVQVCPQKAHVFTDRHLLLRDRCGLCFRCSKICPPAALKRVGKQMTVEDCMEEIRCDLPFYAHSGGGVTLSGGEVLMQKEFVKELLAACRQEGISTAIESNLSFPWISIVPLLAFLDLVMTDIKHMDSNRHCQGTGQPNDVILENLQKLDAAGIPFIVRTPVIPGFNDKEENIGATALFLSHFKNLQYYELLSYNPLGNDKRKRFGYEVSNILIPQKQQMDQLGRQAKSYGITVWVDGTKVL